jgi:hypothetical protein
MGFDGVELQGSFGILAKLWQDREEGPFFARFWGHGTELWRFLKELND